MRNEVFLSRMFSNKWKEMKGILTMNIIYLFAIYVERFLDKNKFIKYTPFSKISASLYVIFKISLNKTKLKYIIIIRLKYVI